MQRCDALESTSVTRLDRWIDRVVSSPRDQIADEATFQAAAGSAPPDQQLGESERARLESRAAAFAPFRPPTPNDWVGWPGSGYGSRSEWKQ